MALGTRTDKREQSDLGHGTPPAVLEGQTGGSGPIKSDRWGAVVRPRRRERASLYVN